MNGEFKAADEEDFFNDVVGDQELVQTATSTKKDEDGNEQTVASQKFPNGFQLDFVQSTIMLDEENPKIATEDV